MERASFWEQYAGSTSPVDGKPRREEDVRRAVRDGDIIEQVVTDFLVQEKEARVDVLTGLPNERAFRERLGEVGPRAERSGEGACISSIDLVGLRKLNEVDHSLGDRALETFARALREARRRVTDFVGRVSGDQFAAVFEGDSNPQAYFVEVQNLLDKPAYAVAGRYLSFYAASAKYRPEANLRPSSELIARKVTETYERSQAELSIVKEQRKQVDAA